MKKHILAENWRLFLHRSREIPEHFTLPEEGIKCKVPGTVHTDLHRAGLIPDPFFDRNEQQLQWIARNEWRYECRFNLPEDFKTEDPVFLIFEGLDTLASVFLNGQPIIRAKNMFRRYRIPVTQWLRETDNLLSIVFHSAPEFGKKMETDFQQMPSVIFPERAVVRKAQYSYGWDWGPSFPTCGIWKPVYLLQQKRGIETVWFDTIKTGKKKATVKIGVNLWGMLEQNDELEIVFRHYSKDGVERRQAEVLFPVYNENSLQLIVEDPVLWWPNGHGTPQLHKLEVRLKDEHGETIEAKTIVVGIRTIELVTSEDGEARFFFKVNGKPIFVKGVNWIPAHSFLPEVTDDTYEFYLKQAARANMNMVRVWGGGIYESDVFYQCCDRLGLMVWQDFMFACSAYPEDDGFLAQVKEEVRENILRLRYHPSLAIWCGNNENEWIWFRDMAQPMEEMPGYRLFHHLIPQWVNQYDPLRPYWPTTPWGLEKDPNGLETGNRHVWEIWSWWEDYPKVREDRSLFVTEFGFQAPAHYNTLSGCMPPEKFSVQSRSFEWHNKQVDGPERLFRFLSAHLPVVTDMPAFVYLTQLNQAFALKTCLEHWQLQKPHTMGAIIWQLNDCWPVTSWSLIDFERRPKLAYYWVKNILAEQNILFFPLKSGMKIFVQNLQKQKLTFSLLHIPDGGWEIEEVKNLTIKAQEKEAICSLHFSELHRPGILVGTLYDAQKRIVARNFFNLVPWKYLRLQYKRDQLTLHHQEGLWIECREFATLFVEVRHPLVDFENQAMIMLPGERVELLNKNAIPEDFNISQVQIFCLNQFLAG